MVDQLIAIDDELISDADLAELESVEALEVSAYV
jgi:aspartate 1-decarboxylase